MSFFSLFQMSTNKKTKIFQSFFKNFILLIFFYTAGSY